MKSNIKMLIVASLVISTLTGTVNAAPYCKNDAKMAEKVQVLKKMEKIKRDANWVKKLTYVRSLNDAIQKGCHPDESLGLTKRLNAISARNGNDLVKQIQKAISLSPFVGGNVKVYDQYAEYGITPLGNLYDGKEIDIVINNSWMTQYSNDRLFMEEAIVSAKLSKAKNGLFRLKVVSFKMETVPAD